MNTAEEIADAIKSTEGLLLRFLAGFDDSNGYAQSPDLPNHAAWILGHLALTMHRAAERVTGTTIELAWDPEPFAFGSTPEGCGPSFETMVDRYRRAMDVLVDAARRAGPQRLAARVQWGGGDTTGRDLLLRMVWHNGVHCGQLIDLRRALGMERVIRP